MNGIKLRKKRRARSAKQGRAGKPGQPAGSPLLGAAGSPALTVAELNAIREADQFKIKILLKWSVSLSRPGSGLLLHLFRDPLEVPGDVVGADADGGGIVRRAAARR